jgi:hypothetical protein
MLNKFCSSEITKVVTALVEAPPYISRRFSREL